MNLRELQRQWATRFQTGKSPSPKELIEVQQDFIVNHGLKAFDQLVKEIESEVGRAMIVDERNKKGTIPPKTVERKRIKRWRRMIERR